jgi:hypothetical protein
MAVRLLSSVTGVDLLERVWGSLATNVIKDDFLRFAKALAAAGTSAFKDSEARLLTGGLGAISLETAEKALVNLESPASSKGGSPRTCRCQAATAFSILDCPSFWPKLHRSSSDARSQT